MGLSCCHWNITFTFLFSSLPQNFPENWLYGVKLVSLKYHLHFFSSSLAQIILENLWLYGVKMLSLKYHCHFLFSSLPQIFLDNLWLYGVKKCYHFHEFSLKTCGCMGVSCYYWNITYIIEISLSLSFFLLENLWLYGGKLLLWSAPPRHGGGQPPNASHQCLTITTRWNRNWLREKSNSCQN